ncbi:MAG TPA: hypothetical protein IAA29_16120 [Candidatus Paenibacillus intestinavium]|nr:hypothetical protein [Candidatus Paenibacillus intestinavium]
MNNETNNEKNENQGTFSIEKWNELINAVQHNGFVSLRTYFDEVTGRVWNHEAFGPMLIYSVKDDSKNDYECGFFLRELIGKYQSGKDPSQWMASFFIELMKTEGGNSLPIPPKSDDEAKAIIDHQILAPCIAAVKEEFAPEQVHAGLEWNQEHGPVFKAGFPSIKEGNNVCAFKIDLLIMHVLLNRDPSELLLQGLYKIREEQGVEQTSEVH